MRLACKVPTTLFPSTPSLAAARSCHQSQVPELTRVEEAASSQGCACWRQSIMFPYSKCSVKICLRFAACFPISASRNLKSCLRVRRVLQHCLGFNPDAFLHSHCLSHSGSLSWRLRFEVIKMAKLNLQVDQAPGHRAGQTEC